MSDFSDIPVRSVNTVDFTDIYGIVHHRLNLINGYKEIDSYDGKSIGLALQIFDRLSVVTVTQELYPNIRGSLSNSYPYLGPRTGIDLQTYKGDVFEVDLRDTMLAFLQPTIATKNEPLVSNKGLAISLAVVILFIYIIKP
jgi:hypothetical protein